MPDQAAGLRSLFARRRPSLLVVAGSDARKAAIAAHFARAAADAGRATLLVDGTPGELAQACRVACRHELAHVVAGDVSLTDVARPLTRHLLLLPAARALARVGSYGAADEARLAAAFSHGVADAFAAIGADAQVDLVVVHAAPSEATRAVAAFGRDARIAIVASDDGASLRGAYAEMKALSRAHAVERFEIVTPRFDDEPATGLAFANLAATARRFLEIELVDGGSIIVARPPGDVARRSATPTPSTSDDEVHHAAVA